MKMRYQLPEVYGRFFPTTLLELDPIETKATCSACARAPGKYRGKHTYRADLKCCTFHPWLPNFAVGALLRETDVKGEAGRRVLREKIAGRIYSLPIGMVPSVRYQVEFNARAAEDFGNREDWLCPYYDRGTELCTVWRHRGAVCVSYHCKSVHGTKGGAFWKRFENYLSYVEMALMEEALVQLDFSPRQLSDLLGYLNRFEGTATELRSHALPEKKSRELWNGYADDQEGFFRKSLEIVEAMDRRAFEEAMGETGEELEIDLLSDARIWTDQA